ncbi:ATP-binding protein [Mesorhizobium sp. CO1-1-9]|uniref:ATP-binding protein n=1 Tax=Mesorhizobium sp. CO1-1-9 TaxID=2876630 RepID=UPI001CCC2FD0|nr:YhaN family protein [Mesorhizobium sp. CO1-1-9]MBZ9694900.1 AAA family ATPase [Mesorhizobium sp. CO1-1-9]
MRLRRLDLVRYGKFTDRTIDFGPKPTSGPDLHIVFGLNEAGKSTALSGFLDLLFGIEERSKYNFIHEYGAMRLGGVLELAGVEHAFTRTKQRNNSLLDATGKPVSEMAITAHLAGLSRDAYATMFSLDDETLEAGGEAILESRGDLGKLLFTASAGLGHASDTLNVLEAEADQLHRKQAQGTEIALLKKRLADLKSRRDDMDTLASTYEGLEAERRDAAQQYDSIVNERAVLAARLEAIAKFERARPMLADIRRKRIQLEQLPETASPTRTWTGSIAELIDDDASLRTRLAGNVGEVERLTASIASTEVDELILGVSERIRNLAESKVRYSSAGFDLPTRNVQLQILNNTVATCLSALGRTSEKDPAKLLLPASTVGTLRTLIEQRSGITAAVRAAHDEIAAALDALQSARERVGEERAVPESVRAKLGSALSKARASSHLAEIRAAREEEDAAAIRWEELRTELRPWAGDASALGSLTVPSEGQIASWKMTATDLARASSLLAERLAECESNSARHAARLDAFRASSDVADDEAAAASRRARDVAWETHRAALTSETADDFALALARDDGVGLGRLANASDLAEMRATTRALAEASADLSRLRQQYAQLGLDLEAKTAEVREAGGELLGHIIEPSLERLTERLEDRLEARADALAAWGQIELSRKKAERAAEAGEQIRVELFRALTSAGIAPAQDDTLEAAMALAELFLDRQRKLDAEYAEALRTVDGREEDLAVRRRALAMAERREEEWLATIGETLKGTWLENGVSASGLSTVLEQLSNLAKSVQERDALQLRIDKMEDDRTDFLSEVRSIGADVGEATKDGEAEQLAVRLGERLDRAERARDTKAALLADLKRLQGERNVLDNETSIHERRKNEVLIAFGVDTLTDVAQRDELLRERDRLRTSVAELEDRVAAQLSLEKFEQARAVLDETDFEGLAIEKGQGEQRLQQLDGALQQQLIRQTRAADKIDDIGGDSAVARLDAERRTIVLEIEETATRYIELKLGIMSAGNALRAYRERHRSGMMARASDAFKLMTQSQYSGLTTQPLKGGEVLIAMQRDGQSKVTDALSKGARFQLYLALRLAGYYEFAQFRQSVPFIADDIMETFDHIRSEEVFRLFGEMAGMGQVIYLTHHKHLCEIGKAVVPEATIHQLG